MFEIRVYCSPHKIKNGLILNISVPTTGKCKFVPSAIFYIFFIRDVLMFFLMNFLNDVPEWQKYLIVYI